MHTSVMLDENLFDDGLHPLTSSALLDQCLHRPPPIIRSQISNLVAVAARRDDVDDVRGCHSPCLCRKCASFRRDRRTAHRVFHGSQRRLADANSQMLPRRQHHRITGSVLQEFCAPCKCGCLVDARGHDALAIPTGTLSVHSHCMAYTPPRAFSASELALFCREDG